MRNLAINKSKMFVLNYLGTTDGKDENGKYTGEKVVNYTRPIPFLAHISGARGSSQVEVFGTDVSYDKTIVMTKAEFKRLKITENSVLFVSKKPTYKDGTPLYDYRIERIAETINEVAIAISKVAQ